MVLPLKKPPLGVPDDSIPEPLVKENGGRPLWLLVPYSENTWIVRDTGNKPNCTIRFNVTLPGGRWLSDHPHLLDSIKRVTYGVRTGPLMALDSGATQIQWAANLIVLARWMVSNQIERFEDLTTIDTREYADLAVFGVHAIINTEGILNHYLEGLTALADFRTEDTLKERRFKAAKAFPLKQNSMQDGIALNRKRLMVSAGLGGVGYVGTKSVVVSLLDEVDLLCGFTLSKAARIRRNLAPSIDELDDETVTEEQLRRLLMPFELLHHHRRYLEDGLLVKPFKLGGARAVAQKLGKKAGRTATVPVQQAATFLERSIRWILDYAPVILDTKDWADLRFDEEPANSVDRLAEEIGNRDWPSEGACSPFPLLPGQRTRAAFELDDEVLQSVAPRTGMKLPAALNFLVTACLAVIAAFSARRAAEVVGLKAGCIERDESGQPWLRIFIHKTVQADSVVPVPEIVVSAVTTLERLSQRARIQTGTQYIAQYNAPGTDTCIGLTSDGRPGFSLVSHLRSFGYFLDVPALPDGSRWTFRPHQFRRFFAILYIWVYDLGDWHALSYHLRHFNPEMTRRYVSDPDLGHIIAVANREHTAAILASAALGSTQVGGAQGTRLKQATNRLYDRMSQHVQVVSERRFAQRVLSFVERTGVTLRALPWGYCASSGLSGSGSYECASEAKSSPDFANASVSTCDKCWFNLRTSAAAPYLSNSIEVHKQVATSPDSPEILRRASSVLIAELAGYLATVTMPNNGVEGKK